MISSLQLALGITAFSAAFCLVATTLTSDRASQTAVFFSALIATCNSLCALLVSHIGSKQHSLKAFFRAIFGGMILRMGTTLAGVAIGLEVLLLPALPLAVTLLSLTGLYTAAEVTLWSRQDFSPRVQLS
ncbi:MAG: hypothetical protein ABI565_12120 [Vicinamibacteria bacterium]